MLAIGEMRVLMAMPMVAHASLGHGGAWAFLLENDVQHGRGRPGSTTGTEAFTLSAALRGSCDKLTTDQGDELGEVRWCKCDRRSSAEQVYPCEFFGEALAHPRLTRVKPVALLCRRSQSADV